MAKTIVILGTLDTKGEHLELLKKKIEKRGHAVLILDLSMGSAPSYPADIPAAEIARIAGHSIEKLMAERNRSASTEIMIAGAQQKVLELLSKKKIDGIVRGWSSVDKPGSILYDPEEDRAFIDELKAHLRPGVLEFEEINCNLEDREFAEALAKSFVSIFRKRDDH